MGEQGKGLWSLFWRMILFVPIAAFGTLALALVLGLTVILPFFAVVSFIDARYLPGVVALALWVVWLRFGGRARRFVFEGFEHGSL
jgi:hypothetical protein